MEMSVMNDSDVIKRYVQNLNSGIYEAKKQAPIQRKDEINESLYANKSNLSSNDSDSDRIGLDGVRSCESVFKVFNFEPISFNENNEKCVEFWKFIEQCSDLKPVDCVIMDAHLNKREVCCQTEGQESEGSLWARVLYELRQKKLDKLTLATNTISCKFCEGIPSYSCTDYSPGELIDQEDLVKLNDWTPKEPLQKTRTNEVKKLNSQSVDSASIKILTCFTDKCHGKLKEGEYYEESEEATAAAERISNAELRVNTKRSKLETDATKTEEIKLKCFIKGDETTRKASGDALDADTSIGNEIVHSNADILPETFMNVKKIRKETSGVTRDVLEISPVIQSEADETISDNKNIKINRRDPQFVTKKVNVATSTQRLKSLLNIEESEEKQDSSTGKKMFTGGLSPVSFPKDINETFQPCKNELNFLTDVCPCESGVCKLMKQESDLTAIQHQLSKHLNDVTVLENNDPMKCFSRIHTELINIQNKNITLKEAAVKLTEVLDHIDYCEEGNCDSLENKIIGKEIVKDGLNKKLLVTMYKRRSEKIRHALNKINLITVGTQLNSTEDLETQQSTFVCNSCGLENCKCK